MSDLSVTGAPSQAGDDDSPYALLEQNPTLIGENKSRSESGVRRVAPRDGFEPSTNRLTAGCSTAELPGSGFLSQSLSTYNALIYAACWMAMVLRIKAEEEVPSTAPEYRDYQKVVAKRLIPFVW